MHRLTHYRLIRFSNSFDFTFSLQYGFCDWWSLVERNFPIMLRCLHFFCNISILHLIRLLFGEFSKLSTVRNTSLEKILSSTSIVYFNFKDAELIQYLSPVGSGPSSNKCPRCDSHLEQTTSILLIPNETSSFSPIISSFAGL